MLQNLFSKQPDPPTSLLCFILFTGYLMNRGSTAILSLLSFKIICHQAIIYLSELLHLYTPSPQLRSPADTRVFRTPSFRAKYNGHRSFSYQVPVICNQLLLSVRHSTSVSSFKTSVKTFLLKEPPKTTTFIQFHCPALRSSVCVCVHACVRACVRACVCDVLTFENMYM